MPSQSERALRVRSIVPEIPKEAAISLSKFRDEFKTGLDRAQREQSPQGLAKTIIAAALESESKHRSVLGSDWKGKGDFRKKWALQTELSQKVPARLLTVAVRNELDKEIGGYLKTKCPERIANEEVTELITGISKKLIEHGTRGPENGKRIALFERGLTLLKTLRAAANPAPEQPGIKGAITAERHSSEALKGEFYQALWNGLHGTTPGTRIRALLEEELKLARTDHEEFIAGLKAQGRLHFRVDDEKEQTAVFRSYFITSYTGDTTINLEIMREAPAFGIHLAANGAGHKSKEFRDATAAALIETIRWLDRHRPKPGFLDNRDSVIRSIVGMHSHCSDSAPIEIRAFYATIREVERVFTWKRELVGDAPKRFFERAGKREAKLARDIIAASIHTK